MARTNNLTNFLTDVASAIKTKKGSSTPIPASDFDTEIDNIKSINDGYKNNYITDYTPPTATSGGISSLANGKKVLLPYLIKEIPRMTIDFSNKASLAMAFQYCFGLEKIDVSQWNIGNINFFRGMFDYCYSLKEIDLSSWNTITSTSPSSTAYSVNMIFRDCISLKSADLRCFSGSWNMGQLVAGCTSLEHLDIRGIDLTTSTNVIEQKATFLNNSTGNVPYNCEIIVADATQKAYMATEFPDYTNVKTVAEYEAE